MPDDGSQSALSLEGEVVEIIATDAGCSLCVVLHQVIVLRLASELASDLHLGDRIAIHGALHIESVRSVPDDSFDLPAAPGRRAGQS